jgi:hypothetical protein
MPGDILVARSGEKLLTPQAVEVIEKLGELVFEKDPAVVYQHPQWKSRTPPWRDGWPTPVRRVGSFEQRAYFVVQVPHRYLCDCIDWTATKYRSMSRRRWSDDPVWVTEPRLIEPERGFPLVFEVMGHPGCIFVTDRGRRELEAAGLRMSFAHPVTIRSVKWRPAGDSAVRVKEGATRASAATRRVKRA